MAAGLELVGIITLIVAVGVLAGWPAGLALVGAFMWFYGFKAGE